MAEKNPAKNIDRLRGEAGADQVIPESTFDQYEPATSYKLGTSTLAVNMTDVDWPWLGIGIVNTSRADDVFATQSFQPKGQSFVFQRRWDETPLSASDNFDVGVLPNTNLWPAPLYDSGQIDRDLSDGKMRWLTVIANIGNYWCARTDYGIEGDFELEFTIERTGTWTASNEVYWIGFRPTNQKNNYSRSPNAGTTNFGIRLREDGVTNYYDGSVNGNIGSENDATGLRSWDGSPRQIKVQRINAGLTWWIKDSGDADWVVDRATYQNEYTGRVYPMWHIESNSGGKTYLMDNWTVTSLNTGSIVWDNPLITASWSSWITIEDAAVVAAEQEAYADNAVAVHESTYDHVQIESDITTIYSLIPTVSATAPVSPIQDELWIDTSV